jgi:hypothetical protein
MCFPRQLNILFFNINGSEIKKKWHDIFQEITVLTKLGKYKKDIIFFLFMNVAFEKQMTFSFFWTPNIN